MIPHLIHQVWAGPDFLPYRYRTYSDTWRDQHPDWQIRLWTETDLADMPMINRDLYDRAVELAPDDWLRWRADVARLEIVYRYGGVYVDMDAECVRSFDPLVDDDHVCWFAESPNAPGHATNAVFAAEPGDPFIGVLLETMAGSARDNAGKRINHRVGSRFVDTAYQLTRAPTVEGFVELLPAHLFSAQSIRARRAGHPAAVHPDAYCWHHYDNSARHETKLAVAAFRDVADLLDAGGVDWFITSGLLLGHVREGRILPWDGDIDLGIWPDQTDLVREVFAEAGWRATRDRHSQFWPYHPNGTKIDVHTHYDDGDTVYKLHGKGERIRMDHPSYLFENMTRSILYLRDVSVPSPPEMYLEIMYGPDWLTPIKDWQWDRSPYNITRL